MKCHRTCFLTIGLLVATILLEGCVQTQIQKAPAAADPGNTREVQTREPEKESQNTKDSVESFALTDERDDALLLQVEVHKPQLEKFFEKEAYASIKKYYDNLYAKERTWWKGDLLSFAQEDRQAILQDGGSFQPYQVRETYEVTCNTEQFLSVRRMVYTYTGGAHGNQTVMGETFHKADGSQVMLDDLFYESDYRKALLEQVRVQMDARAAKGLVSYYANAHQLAEDTFDPAAFYLTDKLALAVVYATYTLAPYAAGTQEFIIPFSNISTLIKSEYAEG